MLVGLVDKARVFLSARLPSLVRYGSEVWFMCHRLTPTHSFLRVLVRGPLPPLGWIGLTSILFVFLRGDSAAAENGLMRVPLQVLEGRKAGFTLMPLEVTGVNAVNQLQGDAYLTNAVAHNGSGLALGDVDQDGLTDIYICHLQGANVLYRNEGDWQFRAMAIGEAACREQVSTGACLVDVDGDADLDLLVNGISAGTRLFLNDGEGGWLEREDSGLSTSASAMSMALADIDADGDLDLFCAHYIDVMHMADPTTEYGVAKRGNERVVARVNGRSTALPPFKDRFELLPGGRVREIPEANGLYLNQGDGRFRSVQNERGRFLNTDGLPVRAPRDWSLAVAFRDINGDGSPDLYVCNDNASPDRLWINTGDGHFKALDQRSLKHTSRSAMGVDFADVNRDGLVDFVVLDMFARDPKKRIRQLVKQHPSQVSQIQWNSRTRYNRNTLFLGRQDGTFQEVAIWAGLAASDWSWCPLFLDVDLDGYEDLLVSNGFSFDVMDQDSHDALRRRKLSKYDRQRLRQFHPEWPTPNVAFRNVGNGQFIDASQTWGFDEMGISYGMALGDLDQDGDQDVVVNNLNAPPSLYRNEVSAPRIKIVLRGDGANTASVGARVILEQGSFAQSQQMMAGGRYVSSGEASLTFAVTQPTMKSRLHVLWPDGKKSLIEDLDSNVSYLVDQRHLPIVSTIGQPEFKGVKATMFEDVSQQLAHQHVERPTDPRAFNPLLPRYLEKAGPSLAWFDADRDGWLDLAVSGGSGRGPQVFRNQHGKSFELESHPPTNEAQRAMLGWPSSPEQSGWLVSIAQASSVPNARSLLLDFAADLSRPPIIQSKLSGVPGPVCQVDVDGDGDLDLFLGMRPRETEFPVAADSVVLRNDGGELVIDEVRSASFREVGIVNGACFFHLDEDAQPDLALACEWGAVRVFRNLGDRFSDVTEMLGLDRFSGHWNSVASGDFDGDGRLDLVAGNLGLNTAYSLYGTGDFRLWYGDLDGNGTRDLVETYESEGRWLPMRDRSVLARSLPHLEQLFPTHGAFAQADIDAMTATEESPQPYLELNFLESAIFLNRGGRFEALPLPTDVQMAPIFGVSVVDANADGQEDLFVGQNFFGYETRLTRDDSGQGRLLLGLGDGRFEPVGSEVSGIRLEGEQRGVASADFDQDGRVDLAVAQWNGPTALFRNIYPEQGYRIELQGIDSNLFGIGSRLRLRDVEGHLGPSRIVASGSGYWSQDSPVVVLGSQSEVEGVQVTWPDGQTTFQTVGEGRVIRVKR